MTVGEQLVGAEGRSDGETRAMLRGIVRHYQTLFDVPNVLGVYASMSVVFRKLSEAHIVLATLKDHLELGSIKLLRKLLNSHKENFARFPCLLESPGIFF